MVDTVTKIRDRNPLVEVLMQDLWDLLSEDKFNGMSVAEVVGTMSFIQHDLMNGDFNG